jgi:serine/threonine protein phosphatase PrpC
MTGEMALKLCSKYTDAETMAKRLIHAALSDLKCTDNITVSVAVL